MKLSDYVAGFLAQQGIRHAFVVSGGASLHLIHSIAENPDIQHICPQHEQAGAMAADAYARVTGNLGAAIATSGPGATNLMTGIACAFYDSVPVLFLTGQVATFRFKGDTGVRQIGFQETDTVEMCKYITKYSVMVRDPRRIRYELEKACHIARSGRPGPVLVDIPDDLQRSQINVEELDPFTPPVVPKDGGSLQGQVDACVDMLRKAKRPVLALGWGIRLAKADQETRGDDLGGHGFSTLAAPAGRGMLGDARYPLRELYHPERGLGAGDWNSVGHQGHGESAGHFCARSQKDRRGCGSGRVEQIRAFWVASRSVGGCGRQGVCSEIKPASARRFSARHRAVAPPGEGVEGKITGLSPELLRGNSGQPLRFCEDSFGGIDGGGDYFCGHRLRHCLDDAGV